MPVRLAITAFAAITVATAATAATAFAAEQPEVKPPRAFSLYVDRGYSLPAPQALGVLSFSATQPRDGKAMGVDTSIGGAVGLTEKLGAEASIGNIALSPSFRYQGPQLGLFYTLIDAPALEIDAIGRVTFDVQEGRVVDRVEPGALATLRAPHRLRVDVSAFVPVAPGERTVVGLRAPVNVSFQLAEHWHAIAGSGVVLREVRDPGAGITVPLSATVGYSDLLLSGASVGIAGSVSLPEALVFHAERPGGAQPVVTTVTMYVVTPP